MSRVQVFQKYSPGAKIVPSGGFSPTRFAATQFGSDGAETSVGALVGVRAPPAVAVTLIGGVIVGAIAISVSDWPACTVWATDVEMEASFCAGEVQAEARSIKPRKRDRALSFV